MIRRHHFLPLLVLALWTLCAPLPAADKVSLITHGEDKVSVTTGEKPAAALRVMTLNVRNSGAKDGDNGWSARKAALVAAVRAFDPDLLGVQEVLADQYEDLRSQFADYTLVGVARDDGARKGEWAAILFRTARFEPGASGNFWLSEDPTQVGRISWDAACTRLCTWTRLRDKISGRELLHANTHFDHVGRVAREKSARLILEKLPALAGGAAVILTGDFNCLETDEPYRILTGPAKDDTLRLSDSFRQVHPERAADEASFHGFTGSKQGLRIDWILNSPQLQARAAQIERQNGSRPISDHYAVTAVLEFTARP